MADFAIEEVAPYDITPLPANANVLDCCATSDAKSMLLQWNLDQTLQFQKFRFAGSFDTAADYDRLLKDFLRNAECCACLGVTGTPTNPLKLTVGELTTEIMTMDFFGRLDEQDVCRNGHIRGCFEEVYDGVNVQDMLRDMLVNEESENADLFSEKEKKELIYVLFKTLVVGGSMCQPDTRTERYMEMTKCLYRDLLTVYKAPTSGAVTVSGKVYQVRAVDGLDLHRNPDKPFNTFLVMVEPMRKEISVFKNDHVPYW